MIYDQNKKTHRKKPAKTLNNSINKCQLQYNDFWIKELKDKMENLRMKYNKKRLKSWRRFKMNLFLKSIFTGIKHSE